MHPDFPSSCLWHAINFSLSTFKYYLRTRIYHTYVRARPLSPSPISVCASTCPACLPHLRPPGARALLRSFAPVLLLMLARAAYRRSLALPPYVPPCLIISYRRHPLLRRWSSSLSHSPLSAAPRLSCVCFALFLVMCIRLAFDHLSIYIWLRRSFCHRYLRFFCPCITLLLVSHDFFTFEIVGHFNRYSSLAFLFRPILWPVFTRRIVPPFQSCPLLIHYILMWAYTPANSYPSVSSLDRSS